MNVEAEEKRLRKKEELRKEIESLLDDIKLEKSFNENSGNLSFLYYQLWQLQKELEKM